MHWATGVLLRRQRHREETCVTMESETVATRAAGSHRTQEGSLGGTLPQALQRTQPCPQPDIRLLASRIETINACFKSPGLWYLVTAAPGSQNGQNADSQARQLPRVQVGMRQADGALDPPGTPPGEGSDPPPRRPWQGNLVRGSCSQKPSVQLQGSGCLLSSHCGNPTLLPKASCNPSLGATGCLLLSPGCKMSPLPFNLTPAFSSHLMLTPHHQDQGGGELKGGRCASGGRGLQSQAPTPSCLQLF